MNKEKIKELEFWIKDANKTINLDKHQFCIDNDIQYSDYYPYMTGYLKTTIKHLKEILEGGD